MRFTLPTGRQLTITELHCEWTYEGLLAGYPNARMNRDIIARTLQRAAEFCSWLPVHLLPPEEQEPDCLPSTCWTIRFLSDAVPGNDDIWSALVVVWFADYDPARPLVDQVQAAVRDLKWDSLAAGWMP